MEDRKEEKKVIKRTKYILTAVVGFYLGLKVGSHRIVITDKFIF